MSTLCSIVNLLKKKLLSHKKEYIFIGILNAVIVNQNIKKLNQGFHT